MIRRIGPKGSGKSWAVHRFAEQLGYAPDALCTVQLYRDMAARDLLQRRTTDAKGNTLWQATAIAQWEVYLLVLDGVEQLHADMLATLQRLHHDR
ncbi:hypothetical protein SYNPS1DRAFT_25544 [Syncephalis pseudoplumigaleata]|uniref:ATPase dynein-related AAA domain-containing protein n=1 Tax=Syncephalis pseudoplumigaleata TaxID=1712513 RepID=A0A4P9YUS3_9FUNG|nr:hypothetical protein SYNPS1DRAFT_25544 [Syncephalis pseudoplumigaleata]|eukprot:RKP22640.1 hypothetical protein SYNPS1DRAFT_25544 [Syncephalis pseudoplumigaleata]